LLIVRVGEGQDCTDFLVNEHAVCKTSRFFEHALRQPAPKLGNRIIPLPKYRSDAFRLYDLWLQTSILYSKPAPSVVSIFQRTIADLADDVKNEISKLMAALLLGHHLLDTDFCDTVIDAVLQCVEDAQATGIGMPPSIARSYYFRAPATSPYKQLMVDLVAWTSTHAQFEDMIQGSGLLFNDFNMAILRAISSRFMLPGTRVSPFLGWEAKCEHHGHDQMTPCYRERLRGYVANSGCGL
jgi:hypothetical protein